MTQHRARLAWTVLAGIGVLLGCPGASNTDTQESAGSSQATDSDSATGHATSHSTGESGADSTGDVPMAGPTPPTGLAVSNVTATSATVTWNASTDADGPDDALVYRVYVGGALDTTVTMTTVEMDGLAAGNSYTVEVSALDLDGQESAKSAPLTFTTSADGDGTGGAEGPLLAFPGALGFGASTVGGRGGQVLVVNTLTDDMTPDNGLLSLREAVTASGPRQVVFSVGGVFELTNGAGDMKHRLWLDSSGHSDLTINCHTAPAPGVIIKGGGIRITNGVSQIIGRYCNMKNIDEGAALSSSGRGVTISGSGSSSQIIFDHMTLSWTTDEAFQVYSNGGQGSPGHSDITLSNSMAVEGDADSSHSTATPYSHAEGPSCLNNTHTPGTQTKRCSLVNNLMANNSSRNGILWGGSGEVSNNIVYNWWDNAINLIPYGEAMQYQAPVDGHAQNNIVFRGPNTEDGSGAPFIFNTYGAGGGVHAEGNYYQSAVGGSPATASLRRDVNMGTVTVSQPTPSPVDVRDMATAGSTHMNCVGASIPQRDAHDARVVAEFHAGTGAIGIGPRRGAAGSGSTGVRDYSIYTSSSHPEGYDTDNDGMPNAWELQRGTNPAVNDANEDDDDDGYRNLEEFLADKATECS